MWRATRISTSSAIRMSSSGSSGCRARRNLAQWTPDRPCPEGGGGVHRRQRWPLRKGRPYSFLSTGDKPVTQPLMPHATAACLVDNSSLTFEQIAEFCGLNIACVQGIAGDTEATKPTGRAPIRAGELTHEEIVKGQN